jgi:hypothetical protein
MDSDAYTGYKYQMPEAKHPRFKRKQDINTSAALAVLGVTDSKLAKGEDLIADPKLRKAFKDAKKRAKLAKAKG